MEKTNPLSPEVRAELADMHNRLIDIESDLIRISQNSIAHRLGHARECLILAIHEMKGEEERWETPF